MKKDINIKEYDALEMVSNKTLATISIIIAIVVGRNEILSFIQSLSQGINSTLSSLPSMLILILLILLIVYLSKRKR